MISNLHNRDIDKNRWDALVNASSSPNVYALSGFLDSVNPQWHGLVLDDYDAVMPLPVKRKLFFPYLVQPLFSQQYSISSMRPLLDSEVSLFSSEINKYISIRICVSQPLWGNESKRRNFVLPLGTSYKNLYSSYSGNCKRNITKAVRSNLVCSSIPKEIALQNLMKIDTQQFYSPYEQQIIQILSHIDSESYEVRCGSDIVAVSIFLRYGNRFYNLFPLSTEAGKEYRAMFMLIDTLIKTYAESEYILDFEGSELSGVRRFYQGFGAKEDVYYYYERHRFLLDYIIKK